MDRLAKRDMIKEHGEEALTERGFREILQASEPHERRYNEEFENHGIQRLVIEALADVKKTRKTAVKRKEV